MSTPKSVIKVKKEKDKSGCYVEYTSNVDAANYYTFELTRAALRDVGKFCKKQWQTMYDSHFAKHTGAGRSSTKVKVVSKADTLYPRMQIGLPHGHKGNRADGFYSYFQEFGTSKTPRLGLLTHAVQDNISEIIKIESQYLSALNSDEGTIEGMVDEAEYEDDE